MKANEHYLECNTDVICSSEMEHIIYGCNVLNVCIYHPVLDVYIDFACDAIIDL